MRLFTPRERTEEHERATLSSWARLATETKGRDRYEDPDPLHTVFQQDRVRVATSPELERLAFVSPGLPLPCHHSLLSHSYEVASVSRTVAVSLGLNEDLVEAIALGRDLGQPPFGRAGQVALAGIAAAAFDAGEQALRVVERLSKQGAGMNLTFETRDGLLHHDRPGAATLEGQLVAEVGRFASLSLELDQALVAGIAQNADVPTAVRMLGHDHETRMAAFVNDVASGDSPTAAFGSPQLRTARDELASWIEQRIDQHPTVLAAAQRVVHCLRALAVHHQERGEGPDTIVDQVCGLSDDDARRLFVETFLPPPQGG